MRVITGSARGRRLREPEGMDIRPTTDQVKEAIFNIVQFDVEGRRVLDLFAGTGQLGVEALSRGAEECVFVDESRQALRLVQENLRLCGLRGQTYQTDAVRFLEHCGRFGLIFVDPPYDSTLCETVLQKIFAFDILEDGGIIICETRRDKALPEAAPPYFRRKEYNYGKVKLTVFDKREAEA